MFFVFFLLTLGLFGKFIPMNTHKVRVSLEIYILQENLQLGNSP